MSKVSGGFTESSVVTKTLLKSLVSSIQKNLTTDEIQYGIDHEHVAIGVLEKYLDANVEECGLFLHESGILGASPDGLLPGLAVVEVKCSFKFRQGTSEEAIAYGPYGLYRNQHGVLMMGENSIYYDQVQLQMLCTNLNLCYFVINIPEQSIIVQVHSNNDWRKKALKAIDFYKVCILPKLMKSDFC